VDQGGWVSGLSRRYSRAFAPEDVDFITDASGRSGSRQDFRRITVQAETLGEFRYLTR